eukprot:CAMPEP_0170198854 /NCGR_PEP_ID=MMETSP0040_2-20121228/69019_1 /TAXON_ID=641309 /ORGANISM="Lotharella oceanica, Strain CCMP622" /LENGTH=306 /DNA_ID=CAMNT_0010448917 /DNA_START=16 /DNA_END=933 /DNA_ORIENTATION=+
MDEGEQDIPETETKEKSTKPKMLNIEPSPQDLTHHADSPVKQQMPSLLKVGMKEGWFIPHNDLQLEEKPFAAGSCARIYRAHYHGLQVCVKQVKDRGNAVNLKDFRREIALWRGMRHPNIVQFIGASFDPDFGEAIIMELMSGGDLSHKMKAGGLSKIDSIDTALSIAKALAYLHGTKPYPIVHRDMKPENIFFDQRGVAKLADMGLARIIPGKSGQRYRMTGKTGTMRYMAPEVCTGDPYDETIDVYGLGLIFYYMVSREMPFKGYSRERRVEFAEARIPYTVPDAYGGIITLKLLCRFHQALEW